MKERITMNSASLQAHFPEVYREFFSKCPLVVSAPGDFTWAGEYAIFYGGLGIAQHIPMRIYAGIKPNDRSLFRVVEIKNYIPSKARWENLNLADYDLDLITNLLEGECKKMGRKLGGDIYGLSEIPMSCGLNSAGAFAASLSLIFFLVTGKINQSDVKRWQGLAPSELIKDREADQVLRLAWKMVTLVHGGASAPIKIFAPLAATAMPLYCFSEKTAGHIDEYNTLDSLSYWGAGFNEIINVKKFSNWPIDIVLIYSGERKPSDLVIKSTDGLKNHLKHVSGEIRDIINIIPNKEKIFFADKILKPDRLWFQYINTLSAIALEIFSSLKQTLEEETEETIAYFLKVIRKYHSGFRLLNVTTSRSLEIDSFLRDYSLRHGSMVAGIKFTGPGKRGDMLFVSPSHDLRDKISDIIFKLRRKTKSGSIFLDYVSWLDGFEKGGLKIEQYFGTGIYSCFISEGSISLKSYTQDGSEQTELSSMEDFEQEKPKIDILLDAIEEDIYIRGKKVTSKEIPSASMAVEILSILLADLGKSISNDKLPESSYSQDRNEMQSKIVSPLARVVKKITGKTLPLKISGGLTEFYLKLEPGGLDIQLINKIF